MKCLRTLLLCLLLTALCAACAMAEETTAEGFTFITEDEHCIITGVADENVIDGTVIVPMTLNGMTVVGYTPAALREDITMFILPAGCSAIVPEDQTPDQKLSVLSIEYKDFKGLSSDELDRLPDIGKDEYALTSFYTTVIARNGSVDLNWYDDVRLPKDKLPQELFGAKAYSLIDTERLIDRDGGWSFFVEGRGDDSRAVITAYEGDADSDFVVPVTVGGTRVSEVWLTAVPSQASTVYLPDDAYFRTREDDQAAREFLVVSYLTYDDAVRYDPSVTEYAPGLTPDDYLARSVYRAVYDGKDIDRKDPAKRIPADTLLSEVDGKKLVLDYVLEDLSMTEGDWTYTVYGRSNRQVTLLQYNGAERTALVVPETLAGMPVSTLFISGVPEEIGTMYIPDGLSREADGASAKYLEISYISYENAEKNNSGYIQNQPDFVPGTLLVTSVQNRTIAPQRSNSERLSDYVPVETLLDSIDGRPLLYSYSSVTEYISRTEGDWTYVIRSSSEKTARLIRYNGAEDSVLVIPTAIGGASVTSVLLTAIPESIGMIYKSDDISLTTSDTFGSYKGSRRHMVLEYMTYEYAVEHSSYYLEEYKDFKEDTLLASSLRDMTWSNGNSNSNQPEKLIPAASVLTQIDGKILLTALIAQSLGITSGDYSYYIYNSDGEICLYAYPESDVSGLTLIPRSVDGHRVASVDARFVPDQIDSLMIPQNCYINNSSKLPHDVKVYTYYDYDYISEQQYTSAPYNLVKKGEYVIEWANQCTKGGDSDRLKQDYYLYPARVGGAKVYNDLSMDYFVTYTSDKYTYYKTAEDEINICAFSDKEARKITVPEKLNGFTVTGISSKNNYVFDTSNLTEITLPSTLRVMGNRVINSSKLTKLTIPEGVTELGTYSVWCYKLKNVTLPSTLKSIGALALYCGATSLTIPDGVTDIAPEAFKNCSYLKSLTLPASLTVIPDNMCNELGRLTQITIPANVTEIGASAFAGCKKLTAVKFQGTALRTIGESAFIGCQALNKMTLPEGLETISYQAFFGCSKLSNLVFPSTVKTIGAQAFGDCKALAKVTMGAGVEKIEKDAFTGCSKKIAFYGPEGSYLSTWAEKNGYTFRVAK